MNKTIQNAAMVLALLGAAWSAQAALQARDLNGDTVTDAYYDTELNITWLRDWNAAAGSSYDNGFSSTDGRMSWANANNWAQNLSFGGYTDWRLPTMVDTGTAGCTFSFGGGSVANGYDCGYNPLTKSGSTVYSEMAHLYYVTLGSEGYCKPAPDSTTSSCVADPSWTSDPQADYAAANSGGRPFQNMQSVVYWSGLGYLSPTSGSAWRFNIDSGYQGATGQSLEFYAVAVRPGDVAASVPEPQALALTLLALGAATAVRRRRSH